MAVDGNRKRRHSSDQVKKKWYAWRRSKRMSRRFLTPNDPPAETSILEFLEWAGLVKVQPH